ncbi:MAG: hypothetical protein CMH34_13385 [Microbacterium sp.]|nr:hypothetical protein [Microbacterium sp.]
MAAGATIHTFTVTLADVDRGVYDDLSLRVARHPSETDVYMLTRVLAYGLEFAEGIAFTEGISATDEPAIVIRDATGSLTGWIEVGAPDAARLHEGSMKASHVAVYTHRDPAKLVASWQGKRIHRGAEILVHSFDRGFLEAASAQIERRTTMSLSVTERHVYLELNGQTFSSDIHSIAAA